MDEVEFIDGFIETTIKELDLCEEHELSKYLFLETLEFTLKDFKRKMFGVKNE